MENSYSIKHTWRIQNFSTIDSDVFTGGPGHKWMIRLYPKGEDEDGNLSIYLEVDDSATLPTGWTRHVKYSLSVVSEIDKHTVKGKSENTFNTEGRSWGWLQFTTLDNLRDVAKRFLVNGTCTIRAEVWFDEEQEKEKPDTKEVYLYLVESSSSFTEFDTLFSDIKTRLQETTENGSFSDEEIGDAQTICKRCLNMDVSSFIMSGRAHEFKNALSLLLTAKAFPYSPVDKTTKFLASFDHCCKKYEAAKRDLKKAREDEECVAEMKTTLKQLITKSMPLRNQAEAIDSEVVRLAELLDEMKDDRSRIGKKLTELTQQAATSKQALLCAEEDMKKSAIKKDEADKTVSEFQILWETLKVLFYKENGQEEQNIKFPADLDKGNHLPSFTNKNRIEEKNMSRIFTESEFSEAKEIFKNCLDMDFTSFVQSGKSIELKNALSFLLTVKAFPNSLVDETSKFVADFDQHCKKYEVAQRILSEAEENGDSKHELKKKEASEMIREFHVSWESLKDLRSSIS